MLAGVRTILRSVTAPTRTLGAVAAAITASARLVLVVAALAFGRHATEGAALAALGFVAFVALRAVRMLLRVRTETELYASVSRAVLRADVLEPAPRDLTSVVTNGVYTARELVTSALPTLVGDGLAAVVLVPVLAHTLPSRVGLLAAVAAVATVVILALTRGATGRLQRTSIDALGEIVDQVVIAVDGRLEIVARGADGLALDELDRRVAAYRRAAYRASWRVALLGRAPLAAGALSIALFVAIDAGTRDELFPFILSDALVLGACVPTFVSIAVGVHELAVATPFVEPFAALLARAPRPEGSAGPVGAEAALPSLRLVDVGFGYREGVSVLEGVDATFAAGAIVAIVGANGAGKSTLLKLVLGLRAPTSGRVLVGERSLDELDTRAWRASTAYLPQRPYLGAEGTTVRAAVHLFEPDATDAEISRVIARVGLEEALAAHDVDPLDTLVDELSAGQRQRLAIARVLLHDARIVLLDEPDANLDAAGVTLIGVLVKELAAAGKLVVVAAHTEEIAALASQRIELSARPGKG